jgi:hypothetical protein
MDKKDMKCGKVYKSDRAGKKVKRSGKKGGNKR